MSLSYEVYVGLGSNLDDPEQQVRRALTGLHQLPKTNFVKASSLYVSAPLGPPGQDNYINAVALLSTQLSPLALLDELQAIEQTHQRVRKQHWGPRSLDLDILLYANNCIDTERLTVPHPHMAQRLFVLRPLAEIAPEIQIPGRGNLQRLLNACPDWELQLLPE